MDARCSVELTPLGFVVVHEGGTMPRSLPGRVLVFAARFRAQQLADAIDAGETERAHELIAHGRWWQLPEQGR
jgi:NADH dehydrogenase FAD-containing subunit